MKIQANTHIVDATDISLRNLKHLYTFPSVSHVCPRHYGRYTNSPIIHMNVKRYLTTGSITHAEEYREG